MYQEYKDRVNFVWVYSREAHPEEYPFLPGFETRDLGWEHRYFHTTTMEERARRAGWIKTDLEADAGMPMIIDYINSPLGPDNAIKNAYIGGGFYSGFVIDCDGTIVHSVNWAWFGPGGQWWGLPLAPVDSLRNFLDGYLADPPPCYDPPPTPLGPSTPHDLGLSLGRSAATVLLVDDDAGSRYEGYFKVPLGTLKIHYDVWDTQEDGSPSQETLEAYNVIVWFTGDTSQNTLTPTDQDNLTAYLDGGGKLFLSGQDIGHDIGGTAFYNNYLHATLTDDDVELSGLFGEDILRGVSVTFDSIDGADNQESPSQIGLLGDAVGVFRYDTPEPNAWAGLRWEGSYRVVYFAFGFEGIGDRGAAAFRFEIMKKIFNWLDELPCPGDIDLDGDVDIADFGLFAGSVAGPDQVEVPGGVDFTHFAKADLDLDEDVDLADFADFQRRFGVSCD